MGFNFFSCRSNATFLISWDGGWILLFLIIRAQQLATFPFSPCLPGTLVPATAYAVCLWVLYFPDYWFYLWLSLPNLNVNVSLPIMSSERGRMQRNNSFYFQWLLLLEWTLRMYEALDMDWKKKSGQREREEEKDLQWVWTMCLALCKHLTDIF